jgi:hypothetical protein
MALPRLHLFELEDQSWFPHVLRRGMTDYLAEVTARANPYGAATAPLAALIASVHATQIRDFCSGGAGPWPQLLSQLDSASGGVQLELTDAYPNADALTRFAPGSRVEYRRVALRATDPWPADTQLATFFSAFHHFRPDDARRILQNACDARASVAVFEATHRSVKAIVAMGIVPIVVLLITPLIRPFRWWRLVFTYLLPIIPLAVWWDGVASCWRTYHPDEMLALAASLQDTGIMQWRAGELRAPGQPLPVTFLIGSPATASRGS